MDWKELYEKTGVLDTSMSVAEQRQQNLDDIELPDSTPDWVRDNAGEFVIIDPALASDSWQVKEFTRAIEDLGAIAELLERRGVTFILTAGESETALGLKESIGRDEQGSHHPLQRFAITEATASDIHGTTLHEAGHALSHTVFDTAKLDALTDLARDTFFDDYDSLSPAQQAAVKGAVVPIWVDTMQTGNNQNSDIAVGVIMHFWSEKPDSIKELMPNFGDFIASHPELLMKIPNRLSEMDWFNEIYNKEVAANLAQEGFYPRGVYASHYLTTENGGHHNPLDVAREEAFAETFANILDSYRAQGRELETVFRDLSDEVREAIEPLLGKDIPTVAEAQEAYDEQRAATANCKVISPSQTICH